MLKMINPQRVNSEIRQTPAAKHRVAGIGRAIKVPGFIYSLGIRDLGFRVHISNTRVISAYLNVPTLPPLTFIVEMHRKYIENH
jgi:hypothetical protein